METYGHVGFSLVCYIAGVATNHETSYKHAGQLKYIDYGGNIVEPERLRHVIYLHMIGLCKLRVRCFQSTSPYRVIYI